MRIRAGDAASSLDCLGASCAGSQPAKKESKHHHYLKRDKRIPKAAYHWVKVLTVLVGREKWLPLLPIYLNQRMTTKQLKTSFSYHAINIPFFKIPCEPHPPPGRPIRGEDEEALPRAQDMPIAISEGSPNGK
jgi:hypothetical protein